MHGSRDHKAGPSHRVYHAAANRNPASAKFEELLAQATALRDGGKLDEAEAAYEAVLRAYPHQPEALQWLGVIKHQRGDHNTALRLLERASKAQPGDAQCLFHLAEIRRALGHYAAAVETYAQVLERRRDISDVYYGFGTALLELGRCGEAAKALRTALHLAPNDPEAHNNLGNTLAALGHAEEAVAHYRTALRLRSDYADAQLNLGLALVELGQDLDAEAAFRAALSLDRDRLDANKALAGVLIRTGRAEEAITLLRGLIERLPGCGAAAHELAKALSQNDQHEEALEWYRRSVTLEPDVAAYWNDLGLALAKLHQFDEALQAYERAIAIQPGNASAYFNKGLALQALGGFDAAIQAHKAALSIEPALTEAHYSLSMIRRGSVDIAGIARLEAVLADPSLTTDRRINGHFALGRLYDDCGEIAKAFQNFQLANSLKAQQTPFDAARFDDYVSRLIHVYDSAFFAARKDHGIQSRKPIFIVGMPRSGTTLAEQILASHPRVGGAGELDDIRHVINCLPAIIGGTEAYPECARDIDQALSRKLADDYLLALERRFPERPHVTDKMTGNYLRLGLIAQLLPSAMVVHCRRDALDTGLSCYFHNFANGLAFSYDLRHLGYVCRAHDRLMEHWRAVLPVPILELSYEALVTEPEAQVRRLLAFCCLPWDERCLAFHRNQREIQTASFWQVRQPLYTSSIGRWRAYAAYLDPLLEGLESGRVGP